MLRTYVYSTSTLVRMTVAHSWTRVVISDISNFAYLEFFCGSPEIRDTVCGIDCNTFNTFRQFLMEQAALQKSKGIWQFLQTSDVITPTGSGRDGDHFVCNFTLATDVVLEEEFAKIRSLGEDRNLLVGFGRAVSADEEESEWLELDLYLNCVFSVHLIRTIVGVWVQYCSSA